MEHTLRYRFEKPFWIIAYILSPAIPLSFYFAGNWFSFFHTWSLSMTFGIIAYVWYLNQFIIAARPSYWDRLYGLDRMYRFHGQMAIWATLFVIAHAVLKRIAFPVINVQQALGITAVFIFVIVVTGTTVFMVESRISRLKPLKRLKQHATEKWRWQYHHLKRFHNLVVLAGFLILAHVLIAFSTRESFLRISLMALWFVVALGLYGYHKMIKPMRAKNEPFTVSDVIAENDSVTTIRITPPEGREFRYKPGQFAYFRFLDSVPGGEEHPFTISSAPDDDTVSFTAKDLGDFSGGLSEVQKGAGLLIDGPYGAFRSDRIDDRRPLVLVAGGIGITPFLSMLGSFAAKEESVDRPIHLLWSVSTGADVCLTDRLERYAKSLPGLGIELFISRAEETGDVGSSELPALSDRFGVNNGRITTERLVERGLVGTGRDFFVCGPMAMMESVITGLRSRGIPGKNIHFEAFAM